MNTPIERGARRLALLALLAVGSLPLAAQAYTYSVLIDSDNDSATGCTVATPNGAMAGVDARLDAQVSFEPLLVQTQQLSLCEGGSFSAPQSLAAGHPVGIDNGPGPTDVVELGFEIALLGGAPGTDWNLSFLASSPLLGAADAAGPVLAVGLGVPVLPPPVQRPVIVPAASAWSLMLLCLALGVAAAWTLRRHPGLMLAALMVGAMSSAGIAWAAGFILDGEIGDWNVAPLLVDPAGDTTEPEPQVDLRGVYAARDGGHVFFRFDVTEMRLPVLVPPFLQTSFSVDENAPNNTLVGSINAAPGGLSTLLRFALSSQSPSAGFSVDAATGEIRVADSSQLDFETRPSFTLDVAVTLQGAAGFSLNRQVTVALNDLNEAPQIAAQAFSVFENAVNGELVGTVVASDPDAGANGQLSYSVVGGTGQAVFAINAASGQITVADANALSLAASPYSLQVQVSDGGTPALSATAVMTITVDDVNDAPSFTPGPSPVTVLEDSAPYSAAWATAISDGDDGTQALTFEFTGNTNPALFAVAPAISPTGVLSFTLAADANGSADLSVRLRDNGGTANGGVDVSPIENFSISVTPVNDAPSFVIPASAPAVLEGAGPQTVPAFATAISAGPPDEAGQVLSFTATVTATTGNLAFASLPALAPNGSLSYAPQAGTSGTATVSVVLSDDGGTANGGVDTSAPQAFTIQVTNVNDAPSFTPGPSPITVLEDSGAYAAAWATDLNDNDGGIQALSFVVLSNSNPALFASGPALSPTGELSFTPAPDANGSATLSVALRDDGGTDNGGVDQSAPVELVLNVTAVNDAPSFVIPAAASPVLQDAGPVVQAGFATAISAGPANEAGQTLEFIVSVTGATGSLTFAQAPAINPGNGSLSFAATNGTSGTATVSVVLRDDGGTANGGVDTSAAQVFTLQVVNVNDAPSFTPGPSPVVVLEDSAAYSAAWATDINDNDGGTQALSFELTATGTTGTLAFTTPPSISPGGVLSFALAPDTNGSASFSVVLRDDGGTDFGGVDVSPPVPLVIEVTAVNDAPSFSIPATAPSVLANSPPQTVAGFATGISPGPVDEAAQNLSFTVTVTGTTGNLGFSAPPAIDASTGTLSYATSANSFGVATISVVLNDDGGTDNGGVNASAPQQFTLDVQFVNTAPSFVSGGNVVVDEDSGPYNAVWATAIDDGDAGISQGLDFIVLGNDNPALFTALPAINAATGALSFQPAPNANGVANLSVVLQDDGGTDNGGADTSTAVDFSITVNAVNDPPVVVPPTNVAVARHIGRSLGSASPESLLANVSDPADGPGAAPFSVTVQTNAATVQGGRVSVAADGSWSYQPPAGAALATDSFNFQVCDSGVPLPPACTVATATIALSGNAVWFVDAAAAPGGDGTLARPFNTLAAATAAAGTNGRIFVASGSYAAGATLLSGQWLIGQGVSVASATSFDTLFGLSPPAGSATRPMIGGPRPLVTTAAGNAITLAAGNSLRGIEIGNTAGIGLVGNDFGTLTLGDNRISGSGQAISLTNGTLAEAAATTAFDQVSSSSGASNIVLSAVAGIANFGSGALSGATGTAFQFSTGTATLSYAGTLAKASAGRLIDIEGAGAANLSLSGDLSCSAVCGSGAGNQGIRISGRTGGTVTLSGVAKTFTGTSTNPAIQLLNNTGATIALSGITNLGTFSTPLVGSALVASGGGTLSVNGELSIEVLAARSLQLSGMTLSGSMTGTIASDGALGAGTPAIDIQNSASPAGVTFGQELIIDHDDAGESGGGINLVGNTGSYVFSNIARVTSANTVALRASNAGTLTVGNVAAGELTNFGGIAIDVQNTTIGINGLNAQRVQSLGGVHGILLNNTGSSGALTITGSGGTCTSGPTCTGGFIANTSSHGVQLVNTVAPSITRMRIQNAGGNGVNGTEVNGFTFASGSIDGTGAAIANNSANIAFNATATGTERNVFGAVSITDSSLSNSRHHGIELFNFNGTLSSVTISGNTLTSSTSTATSQGWGIGLIAFGSGSTVANVTAANITNNVISNFPGGGGIQVQGGNATSPAAPAGTMGTAGSPTNVINITGNRIAGAGPANRIGAEGIVANVTGRGQGNFNISNNGTVANPIANVSGSAISNSAFGLANVTSLIENNVLAPNNIVASQGIGGGLGNTFGVTDAPQMTMTVRDNTISQTDGNGILLVARATNGLLRARVQNNTVAAPLTGVRPGIRIDSGNATAGSNDTVCLAITGNTSAGSGGHPGGIGLRKQGTLPSQFAFGIVGMAATGSPGVETFVNGQNPAAAGTLLISGSSGFTNCNIP